MDKLTSMAVFAKSAELGSFAAAAQALEMSSQMVAKHVAALETSLGITLLNRTTRRQSLTDIGRAYYDRCKMVLAEVDAADSLAQEMHSQPKGLLRVSAPMTFGSFSLAPFVTRYLARYPEVKIDLSLSDRYVDPLEDGYEILIRIGELEDSSLIARPLAPYRLIACAAPSYLARHGAPEIPADLSLHDCLAYTYGASTIRCRWIFTQNDMTHEIEVNGRLRSDNWKALLHAATEGFGIILGPEDVMEPEIKAGRLVRILPDYVGPSRPMHVLYPSQRKPTAKIRSFIEALIDEFGTKCLARET
ncbi:LysR family transcriptional regulator [Chromobacterium sinusclupearum]|uniref:LysR family transcriptional regulator n=2 Tax=Pseudomonadota TaxID=1224 RepID=A0A2K4ML54_9NEIS|nr:LysR family transcriptional regulator [Chromobacterium sinusclupearum]POA97729.1 LysR family transcriptional regulator [Chromobacterium sinusclupearum]